MCIGPFIFGRRGMLLPRYVGLRSRLKSTLTMASSSISNLDLELRTSTVGQATSPTPLLMLHVAGQAFRSVLSSPVYHPPGRTVRPAPSPTYTPGHPPVTTFAGADTDDGSPVLKQVEFPGRRVRAESSDVARTTDRERSRSSRLALSTRVGIQQPG